MDVNDPYKIYNHSTYKIENFYEDKNKGVQLESNDIVHKGPTRIRD